MVVGCAHRHNFDYYLREDGLCFVCPPWQMATRFGHKVVPNPKCQPGGVVLDYSNCNDRGVPDFSVKTFKARPNTKIIL